MSAVRADPGYAIGWHNLGVVSARVSPLHLVASEQAMSQAVRLDASLRGSESQLLLDEAIYSSGLDISKALAPDWSFVVTAEPPHRFTWTMVALLVLQLARAFGIEHIFTSGAEWVARRFGGRFGTGWMRAPVGVALTGAAVVLGLFATLGAGSAIRGLVYAVAAATLVVLPWAARAVRGRTTVEHYGSTPALVLGGAGLLFGLSIAPVPGVKPVRGMRASKWVLWLPALIVGALGLAFAIISFTAGSPTARFLTTSAITLLGAMMLPFQPFDGAWQRNRRISLGVVVALAFVTVALGMNWV